MMTDNKPIGIIVAMDKELKLLLPLMANCRSEQYQGYIFYSGRVGECPVVVMKCGIGKVNAALGCSALIDRFAPALVINSGVAGGTGSEAGILDVVVGDRIAYHDVWCGPGTEPGEAAGCPLYFTSAPSVTSLPCLEGEGIYHGLVCSGDVFVSDPALVDAIRSRFPDVLAVDMESAAIAQTCYLKATDFLCLRVVSDTPGEGNDNIAQYENFWDDAPMRTFHILESLIGELWKR